MNMYWESIGLKFTTLIAKNELIWLIHDVPQILGDGTGELTPMGFFCRVF